MRTKILIKLLVFLVVVDTVLFLGYWLVLQRRHCLHLSKKYCSKGKMITAKGYKGQEFFAVAYTLPEGASLFSPVEADLHISSSPAFILTENGKQIRRQGVMLIKVNEKGKIDYIISFIFATSPEKSQVREVKRGEEIGRLSSKPVYGKYNLLVSVSTWDSKRRMFVSNRKMIEKLILGKDENK